MDLLAFDEIALFGPRWGLIIKSVTVLIVMTGVVGSCFKAKQVGCGITLIILMVTLLFFRIFILPAAPLDPEGAWTSSKRFIEAAVDAKGRADFGTQNAAGCVQALPNGGYRVRGWVRYPHDGRPLKNTFDVVLGDEGGDAKLKSLSVDHEVGG